MVSSGFNGFTRLPSKVDAGSIVSHACYAKTDGGHGAYKVTASKTAHWKTTPFVRPPPSPQAELGWLWRCIWVPIGLADVVALAGLPDSRPII